MLTLRGALPVHGQVLDTTDVRVTLDSALGIARKAAAAAFPELPNYLLSPSSRGSSRPIRAVVYTGR
jgi:hypothetical protein